MNFLAENFPHERGARYMDVGYVQFCYSAAEPSPGMPGLAWLVQLDIVEDRGVRPLETYSRFYGGPKNFGIFENTLPLETTGSKADIDLVAGLVLATRRDIKIPDVVAKVEGYAESFVDEYFRRGRAVKAALSANSLMFFLNPS